MAIHTCLQRGLPRTLRNILVGFTCVNYVKFRPTEAVFVSPRCKSHYYPMCLGCLGERDLALCARASMTEGSQPCSPAGCLRSIKVDNRTRHASLLALTQSVSRACRLLPIWRAKSVEDFTKQPTSKTNQTTHCFLRIRILCPPCGTSSPVNPIHGCPFPRRIHPVCYSGWKRKKSYVHTVSTSLYSACLHVAD